MELFVNMMNVCPDGFKAYKQLLGDLLVTEAARLRKRISAIMPMMDYVSNQPRSGVK